MLKQLLNKLFGETRDRFTEPEWAIVCRGMIDYGFTEGDVRNVDVSTQTVSLWNHHRFVVGEQP